MDVIVKVILSKDEVSSLSDRIVALLYSGMKNIDIVIDKSWEMTSDEYTTYSQQLELLASQILFFKEIKRETICIDILTDIFSPQEAVDQKFTMCKGCPCTHCVPNENIFEEHTGFKSIPFKNFCKKSFIEMKISGDLAKELSVHNIDWSDLDEELWFELQLLKGAQHGIQEESRK